MLEEGRRGAASPAASSTCRGVAPPNYVAIQGFVQPSDEFDEAIAELRARDPRQDEGHDDVRLRAALPALDRPVPQGRPATGVFVQLVHDGDDDIEIPGAGYSFKTLKNAQALGDLQTLQAHDLPVDARSGWRAIRRRRSAT